MVEEVPKAMKIQGHLRCLANVPRPNASPDRSPRRCDRLIEEIPSSIQSITAAVRQIDKEFTTRLDHSRCAPEWSIEEVRDSKGLSDQLGLTSQCLQARKETLAVKR